MAEKQRPEMMPDAEYWRLAYCIERGLPYRPLRVETSWQYWPREEVPRGPQ